MPLTEKDPHTSMSNYRPDIDGLRALAVIPVVLFHAGLGFDGGFVGVDIFFVISGYLITGLIYSNAIRGKFSLIDFWERRIRRILPAMLVVLTVTFITAWFLLLPDDFEMMARSAIAQVMLVSNKFFRKQSGYFAAASDTKPLLHTWSLSVEEQFYLLFPIIIFLAAKYFRPHIPKIILGLLILSFGYSVRSTYDNPAKAFFYLESRAWELSLGAFLAVIPAQTFSRKWVSEIVGWLGIAAIVIAIAFYDSETRFPGVAALLPCLGAFLLIWSNGSRLNSSGKLLSLKPFVFIGLISYSLYLWHWPLIVFAKYWDWGNWNWNQIGVWQKLALILVMVALATVSWRWIETPFRRRVVFSTRPKIFSFALASCVLVLGTAGWIRWQKGLPARFPESVTRFAAMKDDRAFLNNIKASAAKKGNFVELGTAPTNQRISVLIWGDSHAMAATPALDSVCKDHGLRGVQATHSSTAPLYGFEQRKGLRDDAVEFGNAVIDYVTKNQISNVVLAARWEGYPFDDQFKTSLLKTVAKVQEAGARVWILEQVPSHPDDVPRAAAKEVLAGRDPELLGVLLEKHIAARKEIHQLFEQARAVGANILDPTEYFVNNNGLCVAVVDGKSLYTDYHHLTVTGAMRLKPLFEKIVTAP